MSELNYTSLKAGRRITVKKQTVVECVLHTEGDVKIAKVLSLSADGSLAASEALSKELRYNGRINFKVIFMTQNGGISKLNYKADFSDKMDNENIMPTNVAMIAGEVIDVNTVSLKETEINLVCVFEVCLEVLVTEELNCIATSDKLHTKTEQVKACDVLSKGSANFDVAEQKSVKNTVSDVLCSDYDIIVNSTFAAGDMFISEGEIFVSLAYMDSVKDEISGLMFTMPFKFEVEAMGSEMLNSASSQATINSLDVSVSVDEEKSESTFNVKANIKISGMVYTFNEMSIVTDAFSETNEIIPVISGLNINSFAGTVNAYEKVEGNIVLAESMSDIINVLCCSGTRVNIVNFNAIDDSINLEGVINTNILYVDRDGKKNSALGEIPFSVNMENEIIKKDCDIKAKALVCDIYSKSKKGNDLDIYATIKVSADVYCDTIVMAVTEVEIAEEKSAENTISVYFAQENEDIWDVAKQLNCSEDVIMKQNPDLTTPFKGGEQIVVYRQRVLKI